MRRYVFYLDEYQTSWAFSPIRSKFDYLEKLVAAIKVMLFPSDPPVSQRVSALVLSVSKMNRLTFSSLQKTYSISFPFVSKENADGSFSFSSHAHPAIDHKATSIVLGLISTIREQGLKPYDLAASLDDLDYVDPNVWQLLLDLLTSEDGYVRYDDDPTRENGARHPRHHLDVFYSNAATFKLGLRNPTEVDDLIDLLNIDTDCHFLSR